MASIRPTTTPTLTISTNEDLSEAYVELTLACRDNDLIVHTSQDRLVVEPIDGGSQVSDILTAEETLSFPAGSQLRVQLRWKRPDGTVEATKLGWIEVDEILNEALL